MMNFDQPTHEDHDDLLDLTSMVDVVFILLTFFVLTASFVPRQRDAVVGAAQPVSQASASERDLPEAVMVRLMDGGDDQPPRLAVGQAELPAGQYEAITAKLRQIDIPRLPVVILAEPGVRVDHVARALDSVLQSPMKRVSLTEMQTTEPTPDE